jgi:hypothetical protein
MKLAKIEAEALALTANQRAALAKKLLLSLEEISEAEHDRLWGEESARRVAKHESGKARATSGAEVAKKARKLLR